MWYNKVTLEKVPYFPDTPGKETNTMAVSKAQQRAVTKYDAKAYDKTLLRLPKGRLDILKTHAVARGESVNGFINKAIAEKMERDAGIPIASPTEAGTVSLSPATLKAAQEAAEAERETVPVFIARAVESQSERDALSRQLSSKVKGGKTQ